MSTDGDAACAARLPPDVCFAKAAGVWRRIAGSRAKNGGSAGVALSYAEKYDRLAGQFGGSR